MVRRLKAALIILWLIAAGCASTPPRPDPPSATESESAAPVELTLPRLRGGEVSLAGLRGRLVLITLFTTWSLRSQAEAPLFGKLQEQHHDQLVVLGIALDIKGRQLIETYVSVVGLTFDVLLAHPSDPDLVRALGPTTQVPRTLLLDRKGRVVLDQPGQTDFPKLHGLIEALLATTNK